MSERPTPPDQAARDRISEDLGTNLLVTAGAGSGKTTKLVDRYLALLDDGLAPRSIVVVTFTRKAAGEMKSRVRRQLRERAAAGDERSRRLAQEIEDAPIQTMDSFCARILRSEALDAGLDPGFEVMDEDAADQLLREVVVGMLRERSAADDEAARELHEVHYDYRDLVRLLSSSLKLRRAWLNPAAKLPEHPLAARAFAYLRGTSNEPPAAEDYVRLFDQLRRDATAESVEAFLDSALCYQIQDCVDRMSSATPADDDKGLPVYGAAAALVAAIESGETPEAISQALPGLGAAKRTVGSAKVWGPALAELRSCIKLLNEWLDEPAQQVLQSEPAGEESCAVATAALLPLLRDATGRLRELKRSRGLLAFDDLTTEAAKLLAGAHGRQVLARLGQRYARVLVDEYQDTDRLQDSLFRLLAGDRAGGFFAVGDDKQSIYGFRGTDVAVFNEAVEFGSDVPVELSATFRLTPYLADALNALFEHPDVMGPEPHDSSEAARFRPLQTVPDPARTLLDGPPVKFLLTRAPSSRQSAAPLEAARLAEDLAQTMAARPWLSEWQGARDPDQPPRPLRYGDIAVLFRANTAIEHYRDALLARGIPVRTERGKLCRRQETLDLLALGRWLESPGDQYALAAVLRSPLGGLDDIELYRLAGLGGNLPAALEAWRAAPDSLCGSRLPLDRLHRWREARTELTMTEVLRQAVEETGYRAVLAALPGPDRRLANLETALDALAHHECLGATGDEALARLELRRDEYTENDPEGSVYDADADAVTLSTIHGAKGLEWPLVYLADAARSTKHSERPPLCGKWLETPLAAGRNTAAKPYLPYAMRRLQDPGDGPLSFEAERLLYVGCTRARDRLVIAAAVPLNKDGSFTKGFENSPLAVLATAAGLDLAEPGELTNVPDVHVEDHEPLPPAEPPDCGARVAAVSGLTPADLPPATPPLDLPPPAPRIAVTGLARRVAEHTPPEVELPSGLPAWTSPGRLGARLRGDWIHETLRAAGAARSEPTVDMVAVAGASLNVSLPPDDPSFESVLLAARQGFRLAPVQQALGMSQVWVEEPFLLQHRGVLLEGRFDLVGVDSARVLLVDYKSGRPDARLYREYVCETSLYALALSRRFVSHRLEVVMPLVDLNLCLPGAGDYQAIAELALDHWSHHAAV